MGEELAARLDTPDDTPKAYVLFAHCFTCGKDLSSINRIARALNDQGIALFRFDFTGLGVSNGDFANTNFSSNIGDLLAAVDFMRQTYEAPRIMMGHSLGGTAILAAAGKVAEVQAVATIGAPCDTAHVQHHFASSREEIMEKGEAEVTLVGRPFRIQRQFIEDIENQNMATTIKALKKPLMIFHSPTDETVGVENAKMIYEAAMHPKSFMSLDGADHLLMARAEDGIFVANVLAAWAARYVNMTSSSESAAA